MPYLNVDLDFFDHPKTMRVIGMVGSGGAELVLRLWAKAGKFYPQSGKMEGYTDGELESLLGWWGAPGGAVNALVKSGFLERIEGGFAVHDWEQHQGHIWALKVRSQAANDRRWKTLRTPYGNPTGTPTGSPTGIEQGLLGQQSRNPPSIPYHTNNNRALAPKKCTVSGCSAHAEKGSEQCPACNRGVPL